jgi:hypothetical protein
VHLPQDVDRHVWRHEALGLFSSKSSYDVLFLGSIVFEEVMEDLGPSKMQVLPLAGN